MLISQYSACGISVMPRDFNSLKTSKKMMPCSRYILKLIVPRQRIDGSTRNPNRVLPAAVTKKSGKNEIATAIEGTRINKKSLLKRQRQIVVSMAALAAIGVDS